MLKSAYSNRIYKKTIGNELNELLIDCNDIKIKLYSDVINNKIDFDKVNTTYIVNNYGVNTYYANMIRQSLRGIFTSQKKLQEIYIEDYKSKIENQEKKIKKLKKRLQYWKKIKKTIVSHIKTKKEKSIYGYKLIDGKVYNKNKEYTIQEFEIIVDNKIKTTKNNIHNTFGRLNKLNQKSENLKKKTPVCCFGTKAHFKKQFTVDKYKEDHKLWKEEFQHKRHSHFTISGSKNHIDGSMCARYDQKNKVLKIMKHTQGEIKEGNKQATQEWFFIPCEFVYNKEEYLNVINNQETTAYEIIDKGDYFIIKAVFEYINKDTPLFDKTEGVIGLDINVDRYALIEIDKHGNLIDRKVIKFDLAGLSSNQRTKVLEKVAIECVKYCHQKGKPLVRENIQKIKFKNTKNKKRNKTLTQFAYDKMIETIDRCFYKNSIHVYTVKPDYTSQQGKIKYMSKLGVSIHESAAFCIARRLLFSKYNQNGKEIKCYYENMLQYNKFGQIKDISKVFKKIKTHNIFILKQINNNPEEKKLLNINYYIKLEDYIKDVNNYIYN